MGQRAVYKSTSAEFLDDLFSGESEPLEEAFRNSLELLSSLGSAPLSEAASRLADSGELPPEAVEDSTKGWRAGPIVDRIIRHAYEEAIRLAGERPEPVPIDSLWVTGTVDELEVHICDGKRRVTVVTFIPLERSYGSKRAAARSWVVRAGDGGSKDARRLGDGDPPIVMVQRSGTEPADA